MWHKIIGPRDTLLILFFNNRLRGTQSKKKNARTNGESALTNHIFMPFIKRLYVQL